MDEIISLLKPDDIKIWQKRIEFCAQLEDKSAAVFTDSLQQNDRDEIHSVLGIEIVNNNGKLEMIIPDSIVYENLISLYLWSLEIQATRKSVIALIHSQISPLSNLMKINTAIRNHLPIDILIASGEEPYSICNLQPCFLGCRGDSLFLVVRQPEDNEIRLYYLSSVHEIILNEKQKSFAPVELDYSDIFKNSFLLESGEKELIRFQIKFEEEIAGELCRIPVNESQRIEQEFPDGSIVFSFYASSIPDVISWVWKFGSLAEIVAPIEAVKYMKFLLFNVNNLYNETNLEFYISKSKYKTGISCPLKLWHEFRVKKKTVKSTEENQQNLDFLFNSILIGFEIGRASCRERV